MMRKIGVIGVPSSAGARRTGQERAVEWLRNAGLLECLRNAVSEVADFGDLPLVRYRHDPDHPNQQNHFLVAGVIRQLTDRVSHVVASGYKPLILGGDCTITIGAVAGCIRHDPDLALIYFDGDIDMNVPEDTPSGILDGMVISHLIGSGNVDISHAGHRYPLMEEENIFAFGYNDRSGFIDPGEMKRFQQSAIHKYSLGEIRGCIKEAASNVLETMRDRNFVLHLDVDVLDKSEFPAADVPHRYGMSLKDAENALRVFLNNRNCAGMVLTELNSERDPDASYSRILVDLISGVISSKE